MEILVGYGTRPEEIKLRPVIDELRNRSVEVVEYVSGQSPDLVKSDRSWGDSLSGGIGRAVSDAQALLGAGSFDCVIVQGDTATAFAVAFAAFLERVPIAHVEAGLRTYEKEPFPEEAFRRWIDAIADYCFCPDRRAAKNVWVENGHSPGPRSDEKIAERLEMFAFDDS